MHARPTGARLLFGIPDGPKVAERYFQHGVRPQLRRCVVLFLDAAALPTLTRPAWHCFPPPSCSWRASGTRPCRTH